MAEWSIAPHSKCGVRVTVPGVRIPPSPPASCRKLRHDPDVRPNSFWFQKGLAEATVLLRLRQSRNSVSEAPQSHSDRTSPKSVRSENIEVFQGIKTSAYPYWFALVLSPSVGLEPAVRVLERSSAVRSIALHCRWLSQAAGLCVKIGTECGMGSLPVSRLESIHS